MNIRRLCHQKRITNSFVQLRYFRFFLPSYAFVRPKKNANTVMRNKSMYKNWMSERFESMSYNISTEANCVREYAAIYLKIPNEVTKAQRPVWDNKKCYMIVS